MALIMGPTAAKRKSSRAERLLLDLDIIRPQTNPPGFRLKVATHRKILLFEREISEKKFFSIGEEFFWQVGSEGRFGDESDHANRVDANGN